MDKTTAALNLLGLFALVVLIATSVASMRSARRTR